MKLIAWLGRMIMIICFVCGITLFTTWQVVNVYVQKLLEPLQLEAHLPQTGFAEFLGHLYTTLLPSSEQKSPSDSLQTVMDNPLLPASNDAAFNELNRDETDGEDTEGSLPAPTVQQEDRPGKDEQDGQGMEDAIPVWSQQGGIQRQSGVGNQIVISEQQFIETHQNMSNEDKMRILTLVLQKLPQHEMQELSNLMEDGLTAEEIMHLEQTIAKYLSDEEMEELLEIMQKY